MKINTQLHEAVTEHLRNCKECFWTYSELVVTVMNCDSKARQDIKRNQIVPDRGQWATSDRLIDCV